MTHHDASIFPIRRPRLYDAENQRRAEYQMLRYAMLMEDWQDELVEWLEEAVGEEHSAVWGIPDTSMNPMASQTRQLTTPGLYGRPPTRRGPDDDELVGPRGAMRHYWPRMQAVQYLTVGMGIWFQAESIAADGTLKYRSVKPFDVIVWVDDADPTEPVMIWELRLRWVVQVPGTPPRPMFTFDQWDLGDAHQGGTRPPSYRVVEVDGQGRPGEDVSRQFVRDAQGQPSAALEGDTYWWRWADGTPYLPWAIHRATDDGEFWPSWRRSMHSGTLRAATLWTYVHRSALFATGEHTIVGGVDTSGVPGASLRMGDGDQDASAAPIVSMPVHPGTLTFVPPVEGQNLQSVRISAGVNLSSLSGFASLYQMLLANADGHNPSDAMRRSANPTSGAALAISSQSRREFSSAVKPLFLESDLAAIHRAARTRTLAGYPTPEPSDQARYTVEYHTIPLTPSEQADLRDQVTWEEEQGKLGPVESYQRIHPGVDYETAQAAVVAAAVERARVDELIRQALEGEGLQVDPPAVGLDETDQDVDEVDAPEDDAGGDAADPETEQDPQDTTDGED